MSSAAVVCCWLRLKHTNWLIQIPAWQVRNRAFAGKHGGRVVKLQGPLQDVACATGIILSVLCGSGDGQGCAALLDSPVWGYADPVEEVCLKLAPCPGTRLATDCVIYRMIDMPALCDRARYMRHFP